MSETSKEALRTAAVVLLTWLLLLAVLAVDPATCFRDDMMSQYLGASRELWLAARHGHLALVSPRSWFGGAIAGEYQHGVFSVFSVTTSVIAWSIGGPLRLTALVLVAIPLGWLAAGVYRFARGEGCSVPSAVFASLLVAFNGWTLRWAIPWYPSLGSFAWVPWLLWALRRQSRARPFLVAIGTYAIAAGGWPFTILIGALASGWAIAGDLVGTRRRRRVVPVLLGAMLGVCLAAPALLMLAEYGVACERANERGFVRELTVPLSALPSLIAPTWRATWLGFATITPRRGTELFSLVGLAAIASAILRNSSRSPFLRSTWPLLALAALALVLSCMPGHAPLRFTFRWLPLWHLAVAVAGAKALDALAAMPASPRVANSSFKRAAIRSALVHPGTIALGAVLFVALLSFVLGSAEDRGSVIGGIGLAIMGAAVWCLGTTSRTPRVGTWLPSVVAMLANLAMLRATPAADIVTWDLSTDLASPAPLDPARTYLAIYAGADVVAFPAGINTALRPGNVPLLAGLSFVNGYSPMRPMVVMRAFPLETHGWLTADLRAPAAVSRVFTDDHLLEELGVDGLLLSTWLVRLTATARSRQGWSPAAKVDGGFAFERGASPAPRAWLVEAAEGPPGRHARLSTPGVTLDESDTEATVTLDAPVERDALVVFKRPDYPGYQATVDGTATPVERYLNTLVGVRVKAGTKPSVHIVYRPKSLVRGAAIAATALLALTLWACATWARRRRLATPHPSA